MKKYLEVGIVQNVHGVAGDLAVLCLCDSAEVFKSLKKVYIEKNGAYTEYALTRNTRLREGVMLLHINGFETRETATALKGISLFADRCDLPTPEEGSYFIADLLGLSVIDADCGRVYGKITDVQSFGASDIYEVTSDDGKKYLFPAVPEFIDRTELDSGLYIRPIEGMFS